MSSDAVRLQQAGLPPQVAMERSLDHEAVETWLCVILAGCFALLLSLNWKRAGDADALLVEMVFYAGVFRLLWLRREGLKFDARGVSIVLGVLLIACTLFRCLALFWFESFFLKAAPLLAFCGVALLGSGLSRLGHYWRELLVLALVAFPTVWLWPFILKFFHLQAVVASLAGFLLHYLGFEVTRQGISLMLPTGAVEIRVGCSGLAMTLMLLKFALLFVIAIPLRGWQCWVVPLTAMVLGIVLGSMRVAAIAASLPDTAKFDFWHDDPGAQIFSTLAIVLLFFFCRFVARRDATPAGST